MSIADDFSPDITAAFVRKMVKIESRGNGDQLNALERVGRRCGMTARSIRRLVNGETKDPGITVFGRVYAAYIDLCTRQANELLNEVAAAKAKYGDGPFQDLDEQIEDLVAKVRQAKRR